MRFVQLWAGTSTGEGDWDGHKSCEKNHEKQAAKTDKGVAGLLADLAARGLLGETMVIGATDEIGLRAIQVPVPGARFPVDRCAWQDRQP